ncbi:MAG: type II toxin-antitoxin system RelB/DinJ family antitoxin [Clostridia bacterium]|nr:type II toxin-antitoxin system RelB/DinJ family antitoxin [Clostridia bacterium]
MAAKSANLYVTVEPDVKEQAERILSALGIPASNAINMFYHQIILHNGMPFDVTLPHRKPLSFDELSEDELAAELEKGYQDMLAGRTKPANEIFENLERKYGI